MHDINNRLPSPYGRQHVCLTHRDPLGHGDSCRGEVLTDHERPALVADYEISGRNRYAGRGDGLIHSQLDDTPAGADRHHRPSPTGNPKR